MKKPYLIFVSSVILFSLINIGLAKADYVVTVLDSTCGPTYGADVLIGGTTPPCDGVTNSNGIFICSSSRFTTCSDWHDVLVKVGGVTKFDGVRWVDGTCSGSFMLRDTETCSAGYCVDGYCCNSACNGNCDRCNVVGHERTCTNVNSDCTGDCDYCNNGNCAANETICEGYKCSDCTGSGNSFSCTYAVENEDCNPFDIGRCDNDPDLNPFTWDFRDSYCTGLNTCYQGTITHTCDKTTCNAPCSQASDCSNNCNGKQWYSIYSCNSGCNCDLSNPICSVGHCNAECASSGDCGNKCMGQVRYYSGSCLSSCDCSWSTESCDAKDGCYAYDTGCEMRDYSCSPSSCTYTYSSRNVDYYDSYVNYCSADTIRQHRTLHDFYCNGQCSDHTSWQNDTLIQNCSSQDGWYNTSTTQWISSSLCTEKEQVWQEYRDYTCSAAACTYSVTQNRWYDTGKTRNKADGTSCDDSKWCTVNDKCSSGVCNGNARDCSANNLSEIAKCDNNPDNNPFTFDYAQGFTSTCDEINDKCTTGSQTLTYTCADGNLSDNYPIIPSGNGVRTCTAQCDQNSDCASGVCRSDCTCAPFSLLNLTLFPNPVVWAGQEVTATVSCSVNCAGKTLYVGRGQYNVLVCYNFSCLTTGCSCKFTAPTLLTSPSIETYNARIDLNGDKIYNETETASATLTVKCIAKGLNCTYSECCAGLYCYQGQGQLYKTCQYPTGGGGCGGPIWIGCRYK